MKTQILIRVIPLLTNHVKMKIMLIGGYVMIEQKFTCNFPISIFRLKKENIIPISQVYVIIVNYYTFLE